MKDMPIYKEVKKIACLNAQREYLINRLRASDLDELDLEGMYWEGAELVEGLSGRSDGLYEDGHMVAENCGTYYVAQSHGYCEDDYYGYVYFRTDVPGQFVKVYFNI